MLALSLSAPLVAVAFVRLTVAAVASTESLAVIVPVDVSAPVADRTISPPAPLAVSASPTLIPSTAAALEIVTPAAAVVCVARTTTPLAAVAVSNPPALIFSRLAIAPPSPAPTIRTDCPESAAPMFTAVPRFVPLVMVIASGLPSEIGKVKSRAAIRAISPLVEVMALSAVIACPTTMIDPVAVSAPAPVRLIGAAVLTPVSGLFGNRTLSKSAGKMSDALKTSAAPLKLPPAPTVIPLVLTSHTATSGVAVIAP